MKSGARLTNSFVTGLATLVTLIEPSPRIFSQGNLTANRSLRSDFDRIGIDMQKAVESEINSEKTSG
ncbi:MAG: hypothetical protein ACRCU5_13090 [Rhizobiaceae bacterium]